jgi:single-stranded-DNA-specific exonuclease
VVLDEAMAQAAAQADEPVLTVAAEGWHPGVIGIVAGRIKERFGKPALVIAVGEDGIGKGSGRSISGVDLGAAVLAAKDEGLLVGGGGHAMAAGVTLAAGRRGGVPRLSQRAAAGRRQGDRRAGAAARHLCAPRGVAAGLCDALDQAGPYGVGWPQPRVAAGEARLIKVGVVGNGHVRGIACGATASELQVDRLSRADTELGQALLAMPGDRRCGWPARSPRQLEWRQCGRTAPRGRALA